MTVPDNSKKWAGEENAYRCYFYICCAEPEGVITQFVYAMEVTSFGAPDDPLVALVNITPESSLGAPRGRTNGRRQGIFGDHRRA